MMKKASFQEEEENPTEKSYKLDALETTKHRKWRREKTWSSLSKWLQPELARKLIEGFPTASILHRSLSLTQIEVEASFLVSFEVPNKPREPNRIEAAVDSEKGLHTRK